MTVLGTRPMAITQNGEDGPMSMDQPGTSPTQWEAPYLGADETQGPPRKKGPSCGCIVLIVLAILGGLFALVCCGGLAGVGFFFGSAMSEDPEVIAEVSDRLARMDVPEGLQPQVSFDMNVPFSDEPMMTWVVYADQSTQSALIVGSFGGPMAGQNQEDVWEEIQSSMEQQGAVQHEQDVRDWETVQKEITVRGEPVPYQFATGKDDSGNPRIQVTGVFQGRQGPTMVSFSGDAEKYDEETIVKMIESIE
jgi:hypothetical protein